MLPLEKDRLCPILYGDWSTVQPIEKLVSYMSRRAVHGASVDRTIGNIIMLTVRVGVMDDIMKLSANRLFSIGEAHHLDEGRIAQRRYAVAVNCIERLRARV
jgi:hypothetical protein